MAMITLRDDRAHRRSWLGATALALLLVASACAGPSAADDRATVVPPADAATAGADDTAIRVDHVGGYLPAIEIVSRPPLVAVYGDGRVIAQGPVPASLPGPALPNLQQWRIPPDDVSALVRRLLAAGVGTDTDFGRPGVTDMPDTRFTVTTTEGVKQTSVYALSLVEEGPSQTLTVAQRVAREALNEVLTALVEPRGEPSPYTASSVAALAIPYLEPDGARAGPAVTWPGPALPGDTIGPGGQVGCVTVTGDAAKIAANATQSTPWTSGGKRWTLRFRPLLPGESDCADLAQQR